MSENKGEIHIGGGHHLTIKASQIVRMKETIRLFKNNKVVELDIEITTDFEKIPSEYHQSLIHMLTARYGGIVNCHNNTDPFEIEEPPKKRWFQFWK
jgi:hypothetical protein